MVLSGMTTGSSISCAAKNGTRKRLALSLLAEIVIALRNDSWDRFPDSGCTGATSSNADKGEDGTLRLTSVCVPRPYAHFRFLASSGFNNEHQLARHLHSLGGGWEAVAGGMLTLTVPAERASELKRLMYVKGLAPGVLPLEA